MQKKLPIYAIGDIHGRNDLLLSLLDQITQDSGCNPYRLVFLGDYVDRGAQSKAVIETLFQISISAIHEPIFLRGNHDALLWQVITDDLPDLTSQWLRQSQNGSAATVKSYGVPLPDKDDFASLRELPHKLRNAIPGVHKIFFDRLTDKFETDDYFFSHAGIDPNRSLSYQLSHDLRWGHADFLNSQTNYGKAVVHGHWRTQNYLPEMHSNRISIDTGAEMTGNLTAVRLEPGKLPKFLMTCAY